MPPSPPESCCFLCLSLARDDRIQKKYGDAQRKLFKKLEDQFNSLVVKNQNLANEIVSLKNENAQVRASNEALKAEMTGIKKYHSQLLAVNEDMITNLRKIDKNLGDKDA